METGLTYRHRLTGKNYILTNEGLHRAEGGVPDTLSNYTAKDFEGYGENDDGNTDEPSVRDLAKEWGVPISYLDRLGSTLLTQAKLA